MTLSILRGIFILLATAVTLLYVLTYQVEREVSSFGLIAGMVIVTVGLAVCIIAIDMSTKRKRLSALSGVFLGLIAGLLAAFALSFFVDLIGVLTAPEVRADRPTANIAEIETSLTARQESLLGRRETMNPAQVQLAEQRIEETRGLVERARQQQQTYDDQLARREAYLDLLRGVKVVIGLITCYLGISLVIQTKDDFRFVIPYVEFAKEIRGSRPTLLDTSVIIDGRILDVLDTRVMQGALVIPKFVLEELQTVADSQDKLKRARGRRGLEILQKLESAEGVDVSIEDAEVEGAGVDQKLVNLALQRQARVMTNDYNLNKVATLRGVEVINMNDLAKAMRPVVLPGEHMTVKLVKSGESPSQGVGYLEDGTMVVVEGGRDHLDQMADLTVTSTLQTSAGRMIFGKYERPASDFGQGNRNKPLSTTATASASAAASSSMGKSQGANDGDTNREADDHGAAKTARRSNSGRNPRR